MRNLLKPKPRKKTWIIGAAAFTTVLLFVGLGTAVVKINDFFNSHYLQFSRPVVVQLNKPVEIMVREPQIITEKVILDYPEEIDTPIEIYICEKFGPYDCKTALAVAKAESGMREDAWNANSNDSIDVGIFQINSVHFKKQGCSLKELVIAEKNVDCAYQLWQNSGWSPWVAFNSGSFKAHL